eukprot:TRINITY_DN21780_c0_g1_i1.p1 TRINITY_DN21780_c0_g1~~TRINITY_DN21780_c0_g1_i1.p1  ORF type:complete len:619 (+),score=113.31 TRINITY_DN21780_c0_g1_i1:74-1930(+)
MKRKDKKNADKLTRIAIVNSDRCKPKRCQLECKRFCPVVRMGKRCVEVSSKSKVSYISEELCIGCGICAKKCPFEAIKIINTPKSLASQVTHRYGPNSFKLHRLPTPRPGQVLGLVGTNGIGKSTALKILAAKLKPNLGEFDSPPEWSVIINYFRGSELQNYFVKILEYNLKAIIKPQYVDKIPTAVRGTAKAIIDKKSEMDNQKEILELLEMDKFLERDISLLSGGELQRFAIAVVCVQKADVFMFDEPSSYLDVKQRLRAARAIRSLIKNENYIIVVEHDLSVLDYLSDFVCCLYGVPGGYGVVTLPYNVRDGINIFLAGFVPTENMRFRQEELSFKIHQQLDERKRTHRDYAYPAVTKTFSPKKGREGNGFKLTVKPGRFTDSEIVVMLGQNGTGKTTMIRILAGVKGFKPDDPDVELPKMNVSYKPQKISPRYTGTVEELFYQKIRAAYSHPQFATDVLKPLKIKKIAMLKVNQLSGGELQRVALTLALGKPADVYLIDEPSAYLDSEQRIIAAKVIKRFILHAKKTAFIVEHDFIMATYLADRVIVFDGTPSVACTAAAPESLLSGMNRFLQGLDITFRRDPTNYRPRINKHESIKDVEQKRAGTYFFMDNDD